jgi:ABC-type branched-subunit amino acid transport system permease subunit
MTSNVGGIDRILRIVAGLGLIALAATGQIGPWGYVGVLVLATGLFSFCGAYTLFGFSTCTLKTEDELKS